jgi:hypothetical protein
MGALCTPAKNLLSLYRGTLFDCTGAGPCRVHVLFVPGPGRVQKSTPRSLVAFFNWPSLLVMKHFLLFLNSG